MRALACIAFVASALIAAACGGSKVATNATPPSLADGAAQDGARGEDAGEDAGEPGGDDAATAASTDAGPFTVGQCGFSTCPNGCCLDDGGCSVGTAATDPCGLHGERCATCPAGMSCLFGACQQDLGTACVGSNCAGCCFEAAQLTDAGVFNQSTMCFEGTQDDYCGSAAETCTRCSPPSNGGHCVANPTSGGHCEGAGLCNATNCAGCCSGNLCVEGTQDFGCGSGGAKCQDCTAGGGICATYLASDGVSIGAECAYGCTSPGFGVGCTSYCSAPSVCTPMLGQ